MLAFFFTFSLIIVSILGAPVEEVKPNTFEEAIEDVADDSLKVIKSTSDVIDILQQMSSEAAKEASQIAVDFVQDINIGKKFQSLY